MADIAAQLRQRDEDFTRIGDQCAMMRKRCCLGTRHQFRKRYRFQINQDRVRVGPVYALHSACFDSLRPVQFRVVQ